MRFASASYGLIRKNSPDHSSCKCDASMMSSRPGFSTGESKTMFNASDLRKGLKIEIDNEPYMITDFEFCKPGKGQALYRCKLKNMISGNTMDKTFRSADKVDKPDLRQTDMIYSYLEGSNYIFMDAETYEQVLIPESVLGDQRYFLKEDSECQVLFYQDRPIEVTLPVFVEFVIAKTEPGARGDTATNVTKPAWLDNGYEVQVPLFVNEGDLVKVDTRTGAYSERVSKA
jgi:elongation factor P